MNHESSIGAFLLIALYLFVLLLPMHIIYSCTSWVPTISVLNLAISPATKTCCSEGEDGLEFFDEEF
jgi:hypothetical protein